MNVLISIQPKWVEKIISGEKTIEVRKTAPKIKPPFKCYIYCTQGKYFFFKEQIGLGEFTSYKNVPETLTLWNQKIIGEFICDKIEKYTTELNDGDCYEDIRLIWVDDDGEEDFEVITTNERDNPDNCILLKDACLTFADLKKYLYKGKADIITFYGWHISDLKIYDKPKELSEFRRPCNADINHCWSCINSKRVKADVGIAYLCCRADYLTRPPQSWCYVEEL